MLTALEIKEQQAQLRSDETISNKELEIIQKDIEDFIKNHN
jgi:hypothetical protein